MCSARPQLRVILEAVVGGGWFVLDSILLDVGAGGEEMHREGFLEERGVPMVGIGWVWTASKLDITPVSGGMRMVFWTNSEWLGVFIGLFGKG